MIEIWLFGSIVLKYLTLEALFCFAAFERSLTNIRFHVEKNNDSGKYILGWLILGADYADLSLYGSQTRIYF